VLGLIREVSSGDNDADAAISDAGTLTPLHESGPRLGLHTSGGLFPPSDLGISIDGGSPARRPALSQSHTSPAPALVRSTTSLFWFFPHAEMDSQSSTPTNRSPALGSIQSGFKGFDLHDIQSIKLDAIDGIGEILDEIDQASEQVADNALTYINANDTILVQGGSSTTYKFLYTAASKKRKFTVFVVDGSPNNTSHTHNQILTGSSNISPLAKGEDNDELHDRLVKPLAAFGINVLLIPDSAVFAIMSYVNKVILSPSAVLSSGGLLAPVGAANLAAAAQAHKVPVLSLSGIYKLSPKRTFDPRSLREIGDAGALGGSEDLWDNIDVVNPLWDYVPPEKVNLYITNL
jgi:translation initiation factor eIF-2B subunit beta